MADLALTPTRPGTTSGGRCTLCADAAMVAEVAIAIVIDGDQIAADCYGCGRIVRPFSWHGDDGLPIAYIGRIDCCTGRTSAAAWYSQTGAVRAVPAVDPAQPDRCRWAELVAPGELARAILAHLVGLDLPAPIWQAFEADVTAPLTAGTAREWRLNVEDVIDWLEASR